MHASLHISGLTQTIVGVQFPCFFRITNLIKQTNKHPTIKIACLQHILPHIWFQHSLIASSLPTVFVVITSNFCNVIPWGNQKWNQLILCFIQFHRVQLPCREIWNCLWTYLSKCGIKFYRNQEIWILVLVSSVEFGIQNFVIKI